MSQKTFGKQKKTNSSDTMRKKTWNQNSASRICSKNTQTTQWVSQNYKAGMACRNPAFLLKSSIFALKDDLSLQNFRLFMLLFEHSLLPCWMAFQLISDTLIYFNLSQILHFGQIPALLTISWGLSCSFCKQRPKWDNSHHFEFKSITHIITYSLLQI